MHKADKKGRWDASVIECGQRLHQPLPGHQFYTSPPTSEELREFTTRIGFFHQGAQTEVIEPFGFKLDC